MSCPSCGRLDYQPNDACVTCGYRAPPSSSRPSSVAGAPPGFGETGLVPGTTGVPPADPASAATQWFGDEAAFAARNVLAPGQRFGARYQILAVLGHGGMGVVYRAFDEELGVAVALKVIRPEIMGKPGAAAEIERRFKRELVLARQVTHKHVVRIHDLGEVNGVKYLTMPFIEGRDLHSMIAAEGKLPVAGALAIARQVAAGLEAAHAVGVIHRDLKPANVMVGKDGQAVILDFGIARSVGTAAAGTMMTGAVVGTLQYMAPEQAEGREVDQRADIYAFGLLFYDMLVGLRRLTAAESAISDLMARVKGPPRSARELEPHVPDAVSAIVQRCLEPDPAKRYQTTTELLAALDALDTEGQQKPVELPADAFSRRTVLAGATVAVLLIGGLGLWIAQRPAPAPAVAAARDPVSVLIADFDNRTGDEIFDNSLEQALALGIEDSAFVTAFPRRDARRAADQIKPGAPLDENVARLVALSEGIKVVLAGAIAPRGSGFEVAVRAIGPGPDGTLLADVKEEASGKATVLEAVASVARSLREALGDTTVGQTAQAPRDTYTTASLEAAKEYSVAQDLANQGRDQDALDRYRRAVELDPNFGRAYSGWATSVRRLGRRDEAEQLYQKALALLERMNEREKYRTLGAYYMQVARDYEKAIENYQALVDRYPADSAGHNNLAVAYFSVLDFARAREEGGRLLEIYPRSVLYRFNYALYAMYAGDFATAATEGAEAMKLNPANHRVYVPQALSALAQARSEEAEGRADQAGARIADARGIYEKAAAAAGRQGASLAGIGLSDLALFEGRPADAIATLEQSLEADLADNNQVGAASKLVALAEAHAAAANRPAANAAMQRALDLARPIEVLVPAAMMAIDAGRVREAEAIGKELDNQLPAQPRAYGRLIAGRLALQRNDRPAAVQALREGVKLADLWLLRYWLGVALVEVDAAPQAVSELEACEKRIGEATAVFLNDIPSWRYTAPLNYWLGRAREGTGQRAAAAASYHRYLALRPNRAADPLAVDAARRVSALSAGVATGSRN